VNKHKGKVIYVDFWDTWCGPCRGEMPYSLKIQEKMKGKDVVFVYLCSDSSPEMKWKELINKLEITGDHYYVNRSAWSDLTGRFGISGIPHYILIDKDGKVVNTAANRPSDGDLLIKDIEELLKK
jgi:thiol-disulfide isomerase/thioredoxin